MEEKKNNAVEKAENVARKNGGKKKNNAPEKVRAKKSEKNNVPNAKKRIKEEKQREKAVKAQEKRELKEKLKAEREKARAEKRVELARIKAHKKAEKQKAKAAALREKNRRKAEYQARKQQLKAEKEARKQMLKNESRKERAKRVAAEKQAAREERIQKRRQKAERKKQLLADKRAKREEKNRNRQKNKERNKGIGGWLAAVISLGVATLVLASALTFTFLMPTVNDGMLEANYQKSFYDTVEQVNNIDLNLSKALASSDGGAIQKYLVDASINSEIAENDLQQLPLQDESKYYTTKLINQIGDYAKYLNNKLIDGQSLTERDKDGLVQLYRANAAFKEALQKMMGQMGADYSFSSMINGGNGDLIISNFNELQNLSVQYPELIYDGPFSDGQKNREIKGISGEKISEETAKEEFMKAFGNYSFSKVENAGETAGDIECYNVQGEADGELLYAQISKRGGKVVMFAYAGSCTEVRCDDGTAIEKAEEFLSALGFNDMKPVWINLANNVYTINFAFVEGDAIVYSDLVKIRVCAETGRVIGMEASSYYINHTERKGGVPVLSEAEAAEKVSSEIEIENARLAIVPKGSFEEKLCYEFTGVYDGSTYYVYIDAETGNQVEMFKVIESTEGTLLM